MHREAREQGTAAIVAVALMLVVTPLITLSTSLPHSLSAPAARFQFEGMLASALPPSVLGLAILVYFPGRLQVAAWKWLVGLVALLLLVALLPLGGDFLLNALELRQEVAPAVQGNLTRAAIRALALYAVVATALVFLVREALSGARSLSRRARARSSSSAMLYRAPVGESQSARA